MIQEPSAVRELLHSHPQWPAVLVIYHRLLTSGYKTFLAGGCVRDALLGVQASDIDVATDATPDEIEQLFEKTINVGKVFGVMRVLVDGADIEVATFRHDGNYQDGRRPEQVTYSSPQEDAQRRDFTINALFYDLRNDQILDFVKGTEDLQVRVLRTVGSPHLRFQEDHLRLLRGARFAAQLNFMVEPKTLKAMAELSGLVKDVSGERLRDELCKILKSCQPGLGLEIMMKTGMMQQLFPWRTASHNIQFVQSVHEYPGVEGWKHLSLFFRTCKRADLQLGLDLLKLSSKDRRSIEEAWELWQKPADFMQFRVGCQLQLLEKPSVQWALQILSQENQFAQKIKDVFLRRKTFGTHLPKPYLVGGDLKGLLQGEALGKGLKEAYNLQLEGQIQSREQALQWVQIHFNLGLLVTKK